MASLFGSYFVGTYKVNKSFNKKTFLLESMIPISAKKILLAKYLKNGYNIDQILADIINCIQESKEQDMSLIVSIFRQSLYI